MYNALIPSSKTSFGGHGFSYQALVYDFAGGAFALILDLVVPPHIRGEGPEEDEDELDQKFDYEEQTDFEMW